MRKRQRIITILVLFSFFVVGLCHAQLSEWRRVHAGPQIGFGLPKIPFSEFRAPISVLGGGFVYCHLFHRFGIEASGYGLYTFNLGSPSGRTSELKFNLTWGSVDILYNVRRRLNNRSFIFAGLGQYYLDQQMNEDIENLTTTGLCLGIANWRYGKKIRLVNEIRWHLLFHPDPKPQILTVTLGLLL